MCGTEHLPLESVSVRSLLQPHYDRELSLTRVIAATAGLYEFGKVGLHPTVPLTTYHDGYVVLAAAGRRMVQRIRQ